MQPSRNKWPPEALNNRVTERRASLRAFFVADWISGSAFESRESRKQASLLINKLNAHNVGVRAGRLQRQTPFKATKGENRY